MENQRNTSNEVNQNKLDNRVYCYNKVLYKDRLKETFNSGLCIDEDCFCNDLASYKTSNKIYLFKDKITISNYIIPNKKKYVKLFFGETNACPIEYLYAIAPIVADFATILLVASCR